jgi:hypothetical protein
VNPALAVIAVLTIGGAVLAVSARDVRATQLGLLVVLLGAPLVADPWPDPPSVLARIAATLLAVRLIAIGLRGAETTAGTRIGWPAEALIAGAAAVIGFGSHGLGAAGLGPAEAQATGFALVALAIATLFSGRDVLRLAVGAMLLLVGASSIRVGLDAAPGQGEQLVGALLTIAIGGAIAVIATAARAAGGLDAIDAGRPGEPGRRPPDAHRIAEPPPPPEPRPASRRAPRPTPRPADSRPVDPRRPVDPGGSADPRGSPEAGS